MSGDNKFYISVTQVAITGWTKGCVVKFIFFFFCHLKIFCPFFVRWVLCIQVEMLLLIPKSRGGHLVINCCPLGIAACVYNPTTQEAGSGELP